MQEMRRIEHLSAPTPEEYKQGMLRIEHLPALSPEEPMQGVWRIEHLPLPTHVEQLQRLPCRGFDKGWGCRHGGEG
jgi:hypothetical protein